jgi:hypothetical protein
MESEYNSFIESLKDIPIVGVPVGTVAGATTNAVVETYKDIKTSNKINYFPGCMTDKSNDNRNPSIIKVKSQYDDCKRALEMNFGCPKGIDEVLCADTSTAFVTLETVLKKRQADQKATALEKKLSTIVPKLQAMETHVGYLSNFLQQLDSRFSCYAGKCS